MAWLSFTVDEIKTLQFALDVTRREASEDACEALLARVKLDLEGDPFDQVYRDQVKTNDDLECDADAVVSKPEGGSPGRWVMTWTWVTDNEAGIPGWPGTKPTI